MRGTICSLLLVLASLHHTSAEHGTCDSSGGHCEEDHHLWAKRNYEKECAEKYKSCKIALPQYESRDECEEKRKSDAEEARKWYQITEEGKKKIIQFPHDFIPWLNQTIPKFVVHYNLDPIESRYAMLTQMFFGTVEKVRKGIAEKFKDRTFDNYKDYVDVAKAFDGGLKALGTPYASSPTAEDSYTDHLSNDYWMTDDSFVQMRLAMMCPYNLKKVTHSGEVGVSSEELLKQLNPSFDFDKALSAVFGHDITLHHALHEERIFVFYHQEYNDLKTQADEYDPNPNDTTVLKKATSPIAVFILAHDGSLKIAAIQVDYKPESEVVTPASGQDKWLIARGIVSMADHDICQGKIHLGHVHMVHTIQCLAFRRHISSLHPLYDFFLWHCEGTVQTITLGYKALMDYGSPGQITSTMGNEGYGHFAGQAYKERMYGLWDYPRILKSRGLDDERISYYPFRDDAKVIWEELRSFASAVVDSVYDSNRDVKHDSELQSFINELSPDGTGPDGGRGKFRGLPNAFNTREQLKQYIHRFVWTIAFHSTVNYPLTPIFQPIYPTKLYEDTDPTKEYTYLESIPKSNVALRDANVAVGLGFYRANALLDYYEKVRHPALKEVVHNQYKRFNDCVQKELEKRNANRKANNQLGYQYLEPKWIPSSIHV